MAGGYPKVPSQRSVLGAVYTASPPEADISFDTVAGHDHDGANSKAVAGFVQNPMAANLDANGYEIQNHVLHKAASVAGGVEGQIFYDTDDNSVYVATE